jgi:hypothetical protein
MVKNQGDGFGVMRHLMDEVDSLVFDFSREMVEPSNVYVSAKS